MAQRHYPRAPRVKVEIDEDTIARSVQTDSSHCMIAEAVRRAFPDAASVSVDLQTIRFSDPARRRRYTYLTPRRAQVALVLFDSGRVPPPFEVLLQGGHVTAMYNRPTRTPEQRDAHNAELRDQARLAREAAGTSESEAEPPPQAAQGHPADQLLSHQALADGGKNMHIRRRVGGRTPPVMPFARRRAFGLRALERDLDAMVGPAD